MSKAQKAQSDGWRLLRRAVIVGMISLSGSALNPAQATSWSWQERVQQQLRDLIKIAHLPLQIPAQAEVTESDIQQMRLDAKFNELDQNHDQKLTVAEFKKIYSKEFEDYLRAKAKYDPPQAEALDTVGDREYKALDTDNNNLLDLTEFSAGVGPPASILVAHTVFKAEVAAFIRTVRTSTNETAPYSRVEKVLKNVEKAADADAKEPAGGRGLLPGTGYVISGDRAKIAENDLSQAVILRVIDKFDNPGADANAAQFTLDKTAGQARDTRLNGALRLEFHGQRRFKPVLGLEALDSGSGSDRTNTRRYYAQSEMFFDHSSLLHGGALKASTLRFGPYYEKDLRKGVDRLVGLIEWEPLLLLGHRPTGGWWPARADNGLQSLILPRLGLELGDYRKRTPPFAPRDASFVRFNLTAGIGVLQQRLTLNYKPVLRLGLNGNNGGTSRNHFYQEWNLEYALDPAKTYTISGTYQRGEDAPSFTKVNHYHVGLGIKY